MESKREQIMAVIRRSRGRADVVAAPVAFVELMGGLPAAVFLAQALYWTDRTRADGWFYKTYADWQRETGLGESQVRRAARQCQALGFLELTIRKAAGSPTVHYRLDTDRLAVLLADERGALVDRRADGAGCTAGTPFAEQLQDDSCTDSATVTVETSRSILAKSRGRSCLTAGNDASEHAGSFLATVQDGSCRDSGLITAATSGSTLAKPQDRFCTNPTNDTAETEGSIRVAAQDHPCDGARNFTAGSAPSVPQQPSDGRNAGSAGSDSGASEGSFPEKVGDPYCTGARNDGAANAVNALSFPEIVGDPYRTGARNDSAKTEESFLAPLPDRYYGSDGNETAMIAGTLTQTTTETTTEITAETPAETTHTASRGGHVVAAACTRAARVGSDGSAGARAGGAPPAAGSPPPGGRRRQDRREFDLDDEPAAVLAAMAEYRARIGPIAFSMHPEMKQRIARLAAEGRAEWWALALKQAEDNGARYWSYIRAVLDRSMASNRAPGPMERATTAAGGGERRAGGNSERPSPGMVALERFMQSEGIGGYGKRAESRGDVGEPDGGVSGIHGRQAGAGVGTVAEAVHAFIGGCVGRAVGGGDVPAHRVEQVLADHRGAAGGGDTVHPAAPSGGDRGLGGSAAGDPPGWALQAAAELWGSPDRSRGQGSGVGGAVSFGGAGGGPSAFSAGVRVPATARTRRMEEYCRRYGFYAPPGTIDYELIRIADERESAGG